VRPGSLEGDGGDDDGDGHLREADGQPVEAMPIPSAMGANPPLLVNQLVFSC
jgi:hypothetical protein